MSKRRRGERGVFSYRAKGRIRWAIDAGLEGGGRFRKRNIPSQRLAQQLLAKATNDAFEGRHFDKPKTARMTVAEGWKFLCPARARLASYASDVARARHLTRHLGNNSIIGLTEALFEFYREARRQEVTVRGGPPSDA